MSVWRFMIWLLAATLVGAAETGAPSAPGAARIAESATGLELTDPASVQLGIEIGQHAENFGVTRQQLMFRLNPSLEKAGLKPLGGLAEGQLEVKVDSDSTGTFFTVSVSFARTVEFAAGNQKFTRRATVWSRSIHGAFHQNPGIVVLAVGQFADEFIADFLKANPRPDLKGKIVASDPRFQFVVIDIGLDQGVKVDLELAVQRKGITIATVRVVRVNKSQSIANVVQDPPPPELFEGDTVAPRR